MLKPYYNQDNFCLYRGDCLELLAELPEDSVAMIFADPPYNLSNGGFSVHAGKRVSVNKGDWDKSDGIEADFAFHREWIKACRRVLKPHGSIWISGTYHSIYQCGFALQLSEYHILNDICWYKPNAAPNISCRNFAASHESLLWARKDKFAKHTFNYQEMKQGEWVKDFIKKPDKQMRSVWAISTPPPTEKKLGKHPAQKPYALLSRIVQACTHSDDVVLDPFSGSGTTGLAAFKLGRKYIGIDRESEYLDLSIKRLEDIQNPITILKRPKVRSLKNREASRGLGFKQIEILPFAQ